MYYYNHLIIIYDKLGFLDKYITSHMFSVRLKFSLLGLNKH